jgi:hypothetical protein
VTDTIAARVAALKTTSVVELKKMWRELFHNEPPPFNRRFIETRLAHTGACLRRIKARER